MCNGPQFISLAKCLTVPRVWDEADYVVPPAENGAFFITTNVLITPNQTQVRREIYRKFIDSHI